MDEATLRRILAFAHPAWMIGSLALAVFTARLGLEIRRRRRVGEPIGAALRVAHLISAGMPGVIGRTRIEVRDKALALVLPEDLAPLGGSRVARRLGQLAKLIGLEPAIVVE